MSYQPSDTGCLVTKPNFCNEAVTIRYPFVTRLANCRA